MRGRATCCLTWYGRHGPCPRATTLGRPVTRQTPVALHTTVADRASRPGPTSSGGGCPSAIHAPGAPAIPASRPTTARSGSGLSPGSAAASSATAIRRGGPKQGPGQRIRYSPEMGAAPRTGLSAPLKAVYVKGPDGASDLRCQPCPVATSVLGGSTKTSEAVRAGGLHKRGVELRVGWWLFRFVLVALPGRPLVWPPFVTSVEQPY